MRILLLDDDYIITEQLNCLLHLENDWELVTQENISYSEIDLVIIDIFNETYNKILNEILLINPDIRTVTISDKLCSNVKEGCDYCATNYKRVRLIKPVKLKLLFKTIKDFDNIPICPLTDSFKNIESLIPIIIKQFKNLLYDKQSQIISSTYDQDSREHTMQILSLLTLLDKNEIDYTLLNANAIKVHI